MAENLPPPLPHTEQAPSPSAQVDFPCPNCGAKLTWDPSQDALHCDHCDHRMAVPRGEGTILERPLEEAGEAARGLGRELRVSRCDNCGARVAFDEVATSEMCVFCGSSSVLVQEANRNALRPESLIPLEIGRESVEINLRKWTSGLWFRPTAIKNLARFDAQGVYVPCWTFDCAVDSQWSADAGHTYWTTQMVPMMVNGKLRLQAQRVRKVRWVPAWGDRHDVYDDLLVHASKGIPERLVKKLGSFDTAALVPYRPEYLAGWRAEEYQLDLEQGWEIAKRRIVASQEARCAGDVPGDTHRFLRVHNTVRDVHWKHFLLPMWTVTYTHANKPYSVLVNGQNGRVHGQAPYSWVKILLLIAGIAGVLALAGLVLAVAGVIGAS